MTARLTIARHDADFGVYRQQDDGTHLLITTGHDAAMLRAVRAVAEPGTHVVEVDAPHLRISGRWQQHVTNAIAESTTEQRLRTAIADLERKAHGMEESAAYAGSWGDGGAGLLRAEAKGMREAYRMLTGTTLPEKITA